MAPDIAPLLPLLIKSSFSSIAERAASVGDNLQRLAWRANLAAGDFDGDGRGGFSGAGRINGLRQYRSLGGGLFSVVTNLASVDSPSLDPNRFPKPVYSLKTFRPARAVSGSLVVTHAETPRVWLLGQWQWSARHPNSRPTVLTLTPWRSVHASSHNSAFE